MSVPPQPEPNNHTKIVVWSLIGVAIFVLCLVAIVCLGPMVIFAWIVDSQAETFEEQGPHFEYLHWVRGTLAG